MSDNNHTIDDINKVRKLRAYTLGRIEAASGYECSIAASNPQKRIKEILEEHNNRKEEIQQ